MRNTLLTILLIMSLTGYSFAGQGGETDRGKKLLKSIPASPKTNVYEVMQHDGIKVKEAMIDTVYIDNAKASLFAGDTVLDVYFDVHPPKNLDYSRAATTDLHAKFIKRKSTNKWEAGNNWAKALMQNEKLY